MPTHGQAEEIRAAIRDVCRKYPGAYWRDLDKERAYPEAFVRELTSLGWLAALVPADYGGGGMNLADASVVLEEINRSGGNAAPCHAQMYTMGALLKHGGDEQKRPSTTAPSRAAPRPTWRSSWRRTRRGRRRTPVWTRTAVTASPSTAISSASSARRASSKRRPSATTSSSPTSATTCSACRGRIEHLRDDTQARYAGRKVQFTLFRSHGGGSQGGGVPPKANRIEVSSQELVDQFVSDFLVPRHIQPLYGGARAYPEYAEGYYAVYFEDPDRIKVEVVYEP